MKKINLEIIKDIISLIENSSFYNKIQITKKNEGVLTETFYFMEEGIGHAILLEKENSEVETIQESHMIDKDFVYEKLSAIDDQAIVAIAGNSGEYILTIRL